MPISAHWLHCCRSAGWSPDGRTLYFHGFADPSSKKDEVRSISVDGGTPVSLGDVVALAWPNHTDPVTRRITAIFLKSSVRLAASAANTSSWTKPMLAGSFSTRSMLSSVPRLGVQR